MADDAAYSDAFNEDTPTKTEPSEDQAFGLDLAAAEEAGEPAKMPESAEGEMEPGGKAPAVAIVMAPEGEAMTSQPAVDVDRETQRLRSWEGRLKALEAKLKGAKPEMESAAAEALEDTGEQAEDAGRPDIAKAAEAASEQVESGAITADEAMKSLAADFGEDFVKMIEVIASAKAREAGATAAHERVGEIGKTVDEIIADIVDSKTRSHFERIADAYPDFSEIGQSEEFAKYLDSLPDPDTAKRTAQSGSAKEIIKLLDGYKAATTQGDGKNPQDAAMDAAEGVRSTGMKLPQQPGPAADGYEDAWKEFA